MTSISVAKNVLQSYNCATYFSGLLIKKMMMMMNGNDNHGIVSKGRRRDVTNDPNLFSRPES